MTRLGYQRSYLVCHGSGEITPASSVPLRLTHFLLEFGIFDSHVRCTDPEYTMYEYLSASLRMEFSVKVRFALCYEYAQRVRTFSVFRVA